MNHIEKKSLINIGDMRLGDLHKVNVLIKEVFDEFIYSDYSKLGRKTFVNFINETSFYNRLIRGNLFYLAKIEDHPIGVIEIRNENHIALFFVKKKFQGCGTGRALFTYTLNQIKFLFPTIKEITVNSSPFAIPVYESLGFKTTSQMKIKEGMVIYPMSYYIE